MSNVYNPRNPDRKLAKTLQDNPCDGCGRILPKGSRMLIWSVWIHGLRRRLRFCSDCQGVIYGCDSRRPIDVQEDEFLIRDICECCDDYPICVKVDYMREFRPGALWFGDFEGFRGAKDA